MTPTPTQAGALQVGMSVQSGPDGSQWVGLHLTCPVHLSALQMENGEITFMVAMPASAADDMAIDLPRGLRDASKQARTPKLITAQTIPTQKG